MKYILALTFFLSSFTVFASEHQLMVGLAAVDMKPKIGIPLAGYGAKERRLKDFVDWRFQYSESTLFKPSEGVHSPIRSKVMVLQKGKERLAFISLDTIGVEDRFIKEIARRVAFLGIKEKNLIVSATHTHGGPGTLSTRVPLMAVAVDVYRHENYLNIVEKVTESVVDAVNSLTPAFLYKSKAVITGVQKNKWRDGRPDHYDPKATFLLAKDMLSGEWLGGLVNFSIHGGTMPIPLMLYSSDVNGAIEKEIETLLNEKNPLALKTPVMLFMNGAEGDVAGNSERSVENVTLLAQEFIRDATPSLEERNMTEVEGKFTSRKKKIFVGLPKLQLHDCQDGFLGNLPEWIKPSIYPLLPAFSYISMTKVGDMTFLSWPGEASTQLGYDLQKMAASLGHKDPIFLGLVNDYMTYFTTKTEFAEKEYDSCSSFYGWQGGKRILEAHRKWL